MLRRGMILIVLTVCLATATCGSPEEQQSEGKDAGEPSSSVAAHHGALDIVAMCRAIAKDLGTRLRADLKPTGCGIGLSNPEDAHLPNTSIMPYGRDSPKGPCTLGKDSSETTISGVAATQCLLVGEDMTVWYTLLRPDAGDFISIGMATPLDEKWSVGKVKSEADRLIKIGIASAASNTSGSPRRSEIDARAMCEAIGREISVSEEELTPDPSKLDPLEVCTYGITTASPVPINVSVYEAAEGDHFDACGARGMVKGDEVETEISGVPARICKMEGDFVIVTLTPKKGNDLRVTVFGSSDGKELWSLDKSANEAKRLIMIGLAAS